MTALADVWLRSMQSQSCGNTRGQEIVWGAVGYQISVSDSSSSAGSALRGVADSSGWKVGGGAPSSPLGWEAIDLIVIGTSKFDASGRKIKIAAAEIQGRLEKSSIGSLDPFIAAPISFVAGRQSGPARTGGPGSTPPVSMLLIGGCGYG